MNRTTAIVGTAICTVSGPFLLLFAVLANNVAVGLVGLIASLIAYNGWKDSR